MKNSKKIVILISIGFAGLGAFLIYATRNDGGASLKERPYSSRSPSTKVEDSDAGSQGNPANPGDDQTEEEVAVSREEWEERIKNAPLNEKHGLFHAYVLGHGSQLDFGDSLVLLNKVVGPGKIRDICVQTLFALAPQTISEKATFLGDLSPESKEAALNAFHNFAYGNEEILDFSGLSELGAAKLSQADLKGLVSASAKSVGRLTLKSLREEGVSSTQEALGNRSESTKEGLRGLRVLLDKTNLSYEERSTLIYQFLNESSLIFTGVIDYVGKPEVEMTPSDVERFRVEVMSRQIERGQIEPSVGVEKLLNFNLSLEEATTRWLAVESHAPIEWFENQRNLPEPRRNEFLNAIVDFALSKGELDVASEWVDKIQDVELRNELKRKIENL